ncbi:hypothetical protein SLA2020_412960 [Shorea laevis]
MATIFYSLFKLPLFFLLFLPPSANSVSFQISRFESNASNILCHGDAVPSFGVIEMNTTRLLFQCWLGHLCGEGATLGLQYWKHLRLHNSFLLHY